MRLRAKDAGRYLVVFFISKPQNMALPISARDMTNSERRYYNGQKINLSQLPPISRVTRPPQSFGTTHDTTDYLDEFRTVEASTELRARHFEVEIDESVAKVLQSQAKEQGVRMNDLASNLLRSAVRHDGLSKSRQHRANKALHPTAYSSVLSVAGSLHSLRFRRAGELVVSRRAQLGGVLYCKIILWEVHGENYFLIAVASIFFVSAKANSATTGRLANTSKPELISSLSDKSLLSRKENHTFTINLLTLLSVANSENS